MPFLRRIRANLSQWPHRFLNLIGMKIIFQSTLAQMPNFLASLILVPKSVLRNLRSIAINFIWSPKLGQQATYFLVGWDKVTTPLWKGGLGIRDPYLLADVRGEKRCWDLLQEGQIKWKEVLLRKYYFDKHRRHVEGYPTKKDRVKCMEIDCQSLGGSCRKDISFTGAQRKIFVSLGLTKVVDFFGFDNNYWKLISTLVADDNGFMDYHILRDADKLNEEISQIDLKLGDMTLAKIEGLRYGLKAFPFLLRRFYESIHERIINPRMRPYPVRWH
eukprot:Gb_12381 [translate_table: standard]